MPIRCKRVKMEISKKLSILADAAKYDASCASSGSRRKRPEGGLGNTVGTGICHSYTPDGRCISLLKLLLTNYCIYDCLYCVNRISSDTPRARFTPQEIVDLTIGFYRRNYIEGLFLSSGILRSPDYTAELLIEVAKKLRLEYRFGGYIHLKAAPRTDQRLLDEMSKWADRISANIELPTETDLQSIAPAKSHRDVTETMGFLRSSLSERRAEQRVNARKRSKPVIFGARTQSTQMIVGATPASDFHILTKASELYDNYKLSRVYYSAYSPIPHATQLLSQNAPPLVREHRLYQADWLKRFYGFQVDELLDQEHKNLNLDIDPKLAWALRNRHFFPVDVNRASKSTLLRVPGFGQQTVLRILQARRHKRLGMNDLKQFRASMNRAQYFIEVDDRNAALHWLERENFGELFRPRRHDQLTLFETPETSLSALTGQL